MLFVESVRVDKSAVASLWLRAVVEDPHDLVSVSERIFLGGLWCWAHWRGRRMEEGRLAVIMASRM